MIFEVIYTRSVPAQISISKIKSSAAPTLAEILSIIKSNSKINIHLSNTIIICIITIDTIDHFKNYIFCVYVISHLKKYQVGHFNVCEYIN